MYFLSCLDDFGLCRTTWCSRRCWGSKIQQNLWTSTPESWAWRESSVWSWAFLSKSHSNTSNFIFSVVLTGVIISPSIFILFCSAFKPLTTELLCGFQLAPENRLPLNAFHPLLPGLRGQSRHPGWHQREDGVDFLSPSHHRAHTVRMMTPNTPWSTRWHCVYFWPGLISSSEGTATAYSDMSTTVFFRLVSTVCVRLHRELVFPVWCWRNLVLSLSSDTQRT